jgi:hypothetical protein
VLLDLMRRDLVQDERAEGPIQHLQNLALDAPFVEFGMIADVDLRERLERDVGLLSDTVPTLEHPRSLFGFDRLRELLICRLRGLPITPSIDTEVIEPMMFAPRRRRAVHRMIGGEI